MAVKKKRRGVDDFLSLGEDQAAQETNASRAVLSRWDAQRPVEVIKPRPQGDTRDIRPEAVVALAESVDALGLLEPLVIDKAEHLIAGGHRIAALRLLVMEPETRAETLAEWSGLTVSSELHERLLELPHRPDLSPCPVRVLDFDANTPEGSRQALAAESAENTARRQYTSSEVRRIAEKLQAAGFRDQRGGRPKKGAKALRPALSSILGLGERQISRLLNPEAKTETSCPGFGEKAEKRLKSALSAWLEAGEADEKALNLGQRLLKQLS